MLNYISRFESSHTLLILGTIILLGILAVGFVIRKTKLTDIALDERRDQLANRELIRKVEWHNVQNRPTLLAENTADPGVGRATRHHRRRRSKSAVGDPPPYDET